MNIKEKLIKEYPLSEKVEFESDCYRLDFSRYLIFWNDLINKDSVEEILSLLQEKTPNSNCSEAKTLIIVGKTDDIFKRDELVFFNGVNIVVVFYLINEHKQKVFMDDHGIAFLGLNYKKHVKRINEILKPLFAEC